MRSKSLGAIGCLLLMSGAASAALDTSNAYTDGDAVTWAGSTTLVNGDLSADVEWVVNVPVLHGGQQQFEYLYQVSATGTIAVNKLSVGMLDSNEAMDIGSFQIDPTDIAPTDQFFGGLPPDSANWTFEGLTDGDVSYGLNYWSVNEPLSAPGSIHDGGTIAGGILPSPSNDIPEPTITALLAMGGLAMLKRRRR